MTHQTPTPEQLEADELKKLSADVLALAVKVRDKADRWANDLGEIALGDEAYADAALLRDAAAALAAAPSRPVEGREELEAKVADTLAYYQCRETNPKADHPRMGYHAFSEEQREHLRAQKAEAAAEIVRMMLAAAPSRPVEGEHAELIKQFRFAAESYERGVITPAPDVIEREFSRTLVALGRRMALALETATLAAPASAARFTVDDLAQEIRRVDGKHELGAGALAEALMPFVAPASAEPECDCGAVNHKQWCVTRDVSNGVTDHDFLPVIGHPDDDECTFRNDGTDLTYCGQPRDAHIAAEPSEDERQKLEARARDFAQRQNDWAESHEQPFGLDEDSFVAGAEWAAAERDADDDVVVFASGQKIPVSEFEEHEVDEDELAEVIEGVRFDWAQHGSGSSADLAHDVAEWLRGAQ